MGTNMKIFTTVTNTHNLFCPFSLKYFFSNDLKFHQAAAYIFSAVLIRYIEKFVDVFEGRSITALQKKERFTMY